MVKQSGLYEPLSEQAIVGRVNGEWESINWSSSKYISAVVGIEWKSDTTSPALKRIDNNGEELDLTAASFNNYPIHGNMARCSLAYDEVEEEWVATFVS